MKKILLILTMVLVFSMVGCGTKTLKYEVSEINFPLATDSNNVTDSVVVLTNSHSFELYVESNLFNQSFPQAFIDENQKYNDDFFIKHDLIAVIYRAKCSNITNVTIDSVTDRDNVIAVNVKTIYNGSTCTTALGDYFTFYITINKLRDTVHSTEINVVE